MMTAATPAAAAVSPQRAAETTTLGVRVLCLFLFLSYCRLADIFLAGLRIPLILSVVALIIAILTGGVARAFSSRIGMWLTAYSAWIVLAIPFSFWRGGSVQLLTDTWIKSFVVFFMVGGLIRSVRDCRLIMYALGLAELVLIALSFSLGSVSGDGRLMVDIGVLSNSNDLAQLLLLCLPFLLFIYYERKSVFGRLACAAGMLAALAAVGQTGSRGGLVTFCAMLVFLFFTISWGMRAKLLAGTAIAALAVAPFLTQTQLNRFSTIFGDQAEAPTEASGSRENRIELFKQSVALTIANPVFGVGPGVFEPAAAKYSEDRGERALWRVTHNSYTQVSAETGFPGFIFYVGTLLACFGAVRRTYKESKARNLTTLTTMSYCLALSMFGFCVSTVFSSVAYHMYLPTLAGLSLAVHLALVGAIENAASPVQIVKGPVGLRRPPSPSGPRRPVPV